MIIELLDFRNNAKIDLMKPKIFAKKVECCVVVERNVSEKQLIRS